MRGTTKATGNKMTGGTMTARGTMATGSMTTARDSRATGDTMMVMGGMTMRHDDSDARHDNGDG